MSDRVVSGAIGALGIYVIATATTFDLKVVAGPWLVPLLVGILLTLLGGWGVVQPERGAAGSSPATSWVPLPRIPLAATAAILIAFVFLAQVVGFLAAMVAMCVALALPGPLTSRMRLAVGLGGIITSVGLYVLFVHVFNVPLPGPVWATP